MIVLAWNLDQYLNLTKKIRWHRKTDDDASSGNYSVIDIFPIKTNLEQSGSRILDAWSIVFKFSLIRTFYLTKTESSTKKSLKQLSLCFLELRFYYMPKNAKLYFAKEILPSAKLTGPGTISLYFLKLCIVCIYVPNSKFLA